MATKPTKIYPPVGYCIYCKSDTPPLGREHIVPFGLGGNLILPKASCTNCAKVTSRIERECLRQMLQAARIDFDLPTRRPKERPKSLPLELIKEDGSVATEMVDVQQFPTGIVMMVLSDPGILRGDSPSDEFHNASLWHRYRKREAEVYFDAPDNKGLKVGAIHPGYFARMLAKMAHSYAVACNALQGFQPLLPDLILGKDNHPAYLVGGTRQVLPAEPVLHQLRLRTLTYVNGKDYRIVLIRLFVLLKTPHYGVVVGERLHEET